MPLPFLQIIEAWMVTQLLRSARFHAAARATEKRIRQLRDGPDLEEMGGTKLDVPQRQKLHEYFMEELKGQLRGGKSKK